MLAACRTEFGRTYLNAYMMFSLNSYSAARCNFAALRIAAHTAGGVAGMVRSSLPIASVMALITAAGAAIAPASPQPLIPRGFDGHRVLVVSTFIAGKCSA